MNPIERAEKQAAEEGFPLHRDSACLVCGRATPGESVGVAREHEYANTTAIEFPVMRCPECGLVYLYPRPDERALSVIYPADYYSYHMPAEDREHRGWLQQRVHRRNLRVLRQRLLPFLPRTARPLRALDVGCGTGRTLEMLREIYPGIETHGVDLQESSIEALRSRGHVGHLGRFEAMELPSGRFDLVISLHVIEHVARPDVFLERCRDLLDERGVILIETPDIDTPSFRLFRGRHWGAYHAPRHWYLFDRSAFARLAGRYDLELVGAGNYAIAAFPLWTLHSLTQDLLGRRLADFLFPPVKFIHGGLYPTLLLVGLSMLQQALTRLTGRSSAQWLALRRRAP